ncbi:hypothetical protein J2Z60_001087 [Lactobacillus colini]|uniref:Uncharacterized protein n=1 Tax=Lactobacillus colini TaxID=1819254 RepID=A0ABS4MDZ3_9LACO|nr:hypothetical protein [Lactobacillus colini]MBP2057912.1 hypothetical protein [Lactobacillus colini]
MKQEDRLLFDKLLHLCEVLISGVVTATGLGLLFDRSYFFYPPSMRVIENDIRIDALIIIIGLSFFMYLIWGQKKKLVTKGFLIACGCIFMALAFVQFWHLSGMPMVDAAVKMSHSTIGNIGFFLLVNICAYFE